MVIAFDSGFTQIQDNRIFLHLLLPFIEEILHKICENTTFYLHL